MRSPSDCRHGQLLGSAAKRKPNAISAAARWRPETRWKCGEHSSCWSCGGAKDVKH